MWAGNHGGYVNHDATAPEFPISVGIISRNRKLGGSGRHAISLAARDGSLAKAVPVNAPGDTPR